MNMQQQGSLSLEDIEVYNDYYYPLSERRDLVAMQEFLDSLYNIRTYVQDEIMDILPVEIKQHIYHLPCTN